ncbi:arginine decarboxylase, partial [Psychromonas aquatilis]
MHNLFGDTQSVVVNVDDPGGWEIASIYEGDSVEDVMKYVHIDVEAIRDNYRALSSSRVSEADQHSILDELE